MICHFGDNQVLVAANGVGILYSSLAPLVHGSEPVKVVSIKMFGKCVWEMFSSLCGGVGIFYISVMLLTAGLPT